ncbi:hypothetical protein SAMN05421858_0117 [Haladaptatus litoreus]|uniref:LURP-one-related n=1 Tax=Haladaptatus litoreus TaxID=553468 RepID=A0A1N6UW57_9EURY|nr:hypothetical protein [Haladaptatus litoreus]SIQ69771.1 hypothetical protein SAMN05421858_0117 [Haladaptatus litoreus]
MPVRDEVGDLPFGDESYTVKRKFLREEFWVSDSDGSRILDTGRNVSEGMATFPFRDEDDEIVFRVRSKRMFDSTGDYVLLVEGENEPLLTLSKDLSFRRHHWTVAFPDGEEIAEVTSRRGLVGAVNTVSQMLSPLPQTFSIDAPNGEHIGDVAGRLHPRTVYDVRIERPGATSQGVLSAASVAIAVLESV